MDWDCPRVFRYQLFELGFEEADPLPVPFQRHAFGPIKKQKQRLELLGKGPQGSLRCRNSNLHRLRISIGSYTLPRSAARPPTRCFRVPITGVPTSAARGAGRGWEGGFPLLKARTGRVLFSSFPGWRTGLWEEADGGVSGQPSARSY